MFNLQGEVSPTVNSVKNSLLNVMSLSIIIIGALFLLTNMINEIRMGTLASTLIAAPLYIVVVLVYIFRSKAGFYVRAYTNLGIIFITGTSSMYYYGMAGPAILFFLTASFMGTILLRKREALTVIAVNFLTFAVLGLGWVSGFREFYFNLENYAVSYETYLSRMASFIFFLGLIVFSQYKITHYLVNSVNNLKNTHNNLLRKESELRASYDEIVSNRRAIRRQDKRYKVLIDHTENLIFSFDREGHFLSVNPAFQKVTGFNGSDLEGHNMKKLLKHTDETFKNQFISYFDEAAVSGESVNFTGSFKDVNRKRRTFHTQLTPVIDENGVIFMITGQCHDVTNMINNEERIKQLAYYDQLTGLPNRLQFEKSVSHFLEKDINGKHEYALFVLDLDDFKKVNDTMGHQAGDRVLKTAAGRISTIIKDSNVLARMGGDEFSVLVFPSGEPVSFSEELMQLCSSLITALRNPVSVEDMDFYLSASIGIAIYPYDGKTFEELMKNADTAMYKSKEDGKNRYKFYDADMNKEYSEYVMMEAELRKALENKELSLSYQPIISSANRKIKGFEALMRWDSVRVGNVSPDKFIPVMEQTGLIIPYGNWVLTEAARQVKKWMDATGEKLIVSVNISLVQIRQPEFAGTVESIIGETGIEPECLEIEITESVLIKDFESVLEKLRLIKHTGVRIALDDFGTGYSSLNYLRWLPIDTLKIDKTFTDDISENSDQAAIIGSIVKLAHEIGLEVVAEGIEREYQVAYLQKQQCDWLQGFYYYRPLSAKQIDQTFISNRMNAATNN